MSNRLGTESSAERWRAAGVRHTVLLRALPALRHDVAAPISVMQMTASVLQRKLAHGSLDARYCTERVAAIDQQIGVLTEALRWLFDWGVGVADHPITRSQLVHRCVDLLRPLWALEGVTIELDPTLQPYPAGAAPDGRPAEPAWPRQAALRYLLLAALCYVRDRQGGLSGIRVVPDRHDALQLHAVPQGSSDQAAASSCIVQPQQTPVCIDAAALACLAADLGYLVRFSQDGVWLQLADRRSTRGHGPAADEVRSAVG